MRFYTYIGLLRNEIYVREVEDNKECSFFDNFTPTMYTTAPPEKCNYKTLDGKPVGSIKFDNIPSCKEFIKTYGDIPNYPIWGNTNYVVQYISEKYSKKISGILVS